MQLQWHHLVFFPLSAGSVLFECGFGSCLVLSGVEVFRLLAEVVLSPWMDGNELHPFWTCPIGLLMDRTITHEALGDASYGGLGAWSDHAHFDFKFCLS